MSPVMFKGLIMQKIKVLNMNNIITPAFPKRDAENIILIVYKLTYLTVHSIITLVYKCSSGNSS